MQRRGFLKGMAGILAVGMAPSIITTPGLLMPVRQIIVPPIMTINASNDLVAWLGKEHRRLAEKFAVEITSMTATEVLARQEEAFRSFSGRWRRLYG